MSRRPDDDQAAWAVLRQERERQDRLDAVLADLRAGGDRWPVSAQPPERLLAACRQRRNLRTWRHGAWWAAAAAAASLAALAWLGPRVLPPTHGVAATVVPAVKAPAAPAPAQVMEATLSQPSSGTFLPLGGPLPADGFVVRVNLPESDLASLGIAAAPGAGPVPAEVLMDQDGVPRGIRFLQ